MVALRSAELEQRWGVLVHYELVLLHRDVGEAFRSFGICELMFLPEGREDMIS